LFDYPNLTQEGKEHLEFCDFILSICEETE